MCPSLYGRLLVSLASVTQLVTRSCLGCFRVSWTVPDLRGGRGLVALSADGRHLPATARPTSVSSLTRQSGSVRERASASARSGAPALISALPTQRPIRSPSGLPA
jgi:hypothetical protein